jgi:hypothetical protein
MRWQESVRKSGKLLILASKAASASCAVALARSIKEFNRATDSYKLGLKFELTTKESAAQVTIGIGKESQFALATHGVTSVSHYASGEIVKADILLHPSPQVTVMKKKPGFKDYQPVSRAAGEGIWVVIIAHEFIHAVGLEKHSREADVFYSPLVPRAGDKPQDDRMEVPIVKALRMPPVVISAQTAQRLRAIWL